MIKSGDGDTVGDISLESGSGLTGGNIALSVGDSSSAAGSDVTVVAGKAAGANTWRFNKFDFRTEHGHNKWIYLHRYERCKFYQRRYITKDRRCCSRH